MPRLIDANEILKSEHQHYDYMADEYYVLVRDIENAPTVKAVPIKHGKWLDADDGIDWTCSRCRHDVWANTPYCLMLEIRRWCIIYVATQLPFWIALALFN